MVGFCDHITFPGTFHSGLCAYVRLCFKLGVWRSHRAAPRERLDPIRGKKKTPPKGSRRCVDPLGNPGWCWIWRGFTDVYSWFTYRSYSLVESGWILQIQEMNGNDILNAYWMHEAIDSNDLYNQPSHHCIVVELLKEDTRTNSWQLRMELRLTSISYVDIYGIYMATWISMDYDDYDGHESNQNESYWVSCWILVPVRTGKSYWLSRPVQHHQKCSERQRKLVRRGIFWHLKWLSQTTISKLIRKSTFLSSPLVLKRYV